MSKEEKPELEGGWVPAEKLISDDPGVRTTGEDLADIFAPIAKQARKPIVKGERRHRPHDRGVDDGRISDTSQGSRRGD